MKCIIMFPIENKLSSVQIYNGLIKQAKTVIEINYGLIDWRILAYCLRTHSESMSCMNKIEFYKHVIYLYKFTCIDTTISFM